MGVKHGCPPNTLTNLPDNVIDNIFMRLPLRDVVRTSILTKKWRYNWCRLPELKLNQRILGKTFKNNPSPTFSEIVGHLLTYHEGAITKFTLVTYTLERFSTIDNLIYFLSRNGIQHLFLALYNDNGHKYKLPSSFYTCLQMKHLTVKHCRIHPPPAFKGFDCLISLELREVKIRSKFLEGIISYSPLLQYLVLELPHMLRDIRMIAPNLKSLDLIGNHNSVSLKVTPPLVKLSLVNIKLSVEHDKPSLAKFFESFPALKYLKLDREGVRSLVAGAGTVPKELPSTLKRLHLSDIYVDEHFLASDFFCLIRSSPYLQEIEIEVDNELSDEWEYNEERISVMSLEVEGFSAVALNHLRAVSVYGITGTEHEKQLIKLLLAKSPILKRITIEPVVECPETRLELLIELTQFRRASPYAEVVYKVTD